MSKKKEILDINLEEQEVQEVQELELKTDNGQLIIGEVQEVEQEIKEELNNIVVEVPLNNGNITKNYKGIVINTSKLNVRQGASLETDIVAVIKNKDTLIIDPNKSTKNFYFVILNDDKNTEGYCLKDYIVG